MRSSRSSPARRASAAIEVRPEPADQARIDPTLPVRERLECRLALLAGSLEELFQLLEEEAALDDQTLDGVDVAAERLRDAVSALQRA